MIRKSNSPKSRLVAEIGLAVQRFQDATDAFDYAAAKAMALNQRDLKCLSIVFSRGPVSAGEIAERSGLSRSAATTAVDRIEKAGYAKRIKDPDDRRGILIQQTEKAEKLAAKIWGHFSSSSEKYFSQFSDAQLRAILKFLIDAAQMQKEQMERVQLQGNLSLPRSRL